MKRLSTLLLLIILAACRVAAEKAARETAPQTGSYRGWEYLVEKLLKDNVSREKIDAVYLNPKMPPVGFIPFKLAPKETTLMYSAFKNKALIKKAAEFLREHKKVFDAAERIYKVDRGVIGAILLVETHLGTNTGKNLVINRLSRVGSIANPENVLANYQQLSRWKKGISYQEVEARARYLEENFYPEVLALFKIAEEHQIDIMELRGSFAGAFGYPQFLPSTFMRYAVDGNSDKKISLFDIPDAVLSVANYLSHSGWRNDAPRKEKAAVIWKYNHSNPYIETVLDIAQALAVK